MVVTALITVAPGAECGLHCYQCNSSSNDPFPLCDAVHWNSLLPPQRVEMLTGCPSSSNFCLKKVTKMKSGGRLTVRGCYYPCLVASSACSLVTEPGCGYLEPDALSIESKVCFCDRDKCNNAPELNKITPAYVAIFACISLLNGIIL